jgi:hypothetical protein
MCELNGASRSPLKFRSGRDNRQRATLDNSRHGSAVAPAIDLLRAAKVLHDVVLVQRRLVHVRRGTAPVT